MTQLVIICIYMALLLGLGLFSSRFFKGTAVDYFVASRSIGPFLLLMSVFGTTMTAFALVGSTGKAYTDGIGVYGKLASWSGLIHSACFFLVGIKLWAAGKRLGFVTQCQYFRARFDNDLIGYLLFPILVALVIPYLLIGLLGAGSVVGGVTKGTFKVVFESTGGAIPSWLTGLVICSVVLTYVFFGGLRGTAWANTFQTLFFMLMGCVAFFLISQKLGGLEAATRGAKPSHLAREGLVGPWQFFSYLFIPLSVGMFPHLFQHWLTAKSAKTFRLTVIAHPLCIMIVWTPCVLIGVWATGVLNLPPQKANAVIGIMVGQLGNPVISGLLTAGILAAVMSSLDSQFLCIGTLFTNDIILHKYGKDKFTDKQIVMMSRCFIILVVVCTYLLSLSEPRKVFELGVWCFSGFASLFPLVVAAVYWKRSTAAGALTSVLVTAGVWFYLFKLSGYGGEFLLFKDFFGGKDGIMPVAVIFAASASSLVIVSLFTQPPSKETLQKFFPDRIKSEGIR